MLNVMKEFHLRSSIEYRPIATEVTESRCVQVFGKITLCNRLVKPPYQKTLLLKRWYQIR